MFEQRDYMSEMDFQYDEPLFQANRDFMVVPGDTGRDYRTSNEIMERTPASFEDQESMRYNTSLKRELNMLENKVSDAEYQQYQKYQDKLGGTSEKIYFLRLTPVEKEEYLVAKRIKISNRAISSAHTNSRSDMYRTNAYTPANAVQTNFPKINDVALGMSMDDVMQNWGQPERRDVAGNPELKNERWAFRKDGSIKYIYFEAGRVEGWTEQ